MDYGYSAYRRPWRLTRKNPRFTGGHEVLLTASFSIRRFATEGAAQKCADKLNALPN